MIPGKFKMKKFFLYVIIVLVFGMASISTRAQSDPPRPKRTVVLGSADVSSREFLGQQQKGTYSNSFFGFQLTAPESFSFVDQELAKLQVKAGADMLRTEKGTNDRTIDEALVKQSLLFAITQMPLGTPRNSVLEVVALKQQFGVTANMALSASAGIYAANPDFKILKSLDNVRFGGRSFAGIVITTEKYGPTLTLELYVIILRGYSVHFSITSSTGDGREAMIRLLRGLRFTK